MSCPVPCGIQTPLCSALLPLEGEDAPDAQAVLCGAVGMVQGWFRYARCSCAGEIPKAAVNSVTEQAV